MLPRPDSLSVNDCIKIGMLTGAADAIINLPLWTIKTRAQCGLPLSFDPRILYRGFLVDLGLISVLTASQVLMSNFTYQLFDSNKEKQASDRISAAFIGGAITGGLFSPIDLLSIQQHKHHRQHYFHSARQTYKKIGLRKIWTGTPITGLVDGLFTVLYYGIYPLLKNTIFSFSKNEMTSAFVAGMSTGMVAALITHPLDMIKIKQQEAVDDKVKNFRLCIKELYHRKGGLGFFTGFKSRMLWATSYVAVSGFVADKIETSIKKDRNII